MKKTFKYTLLIAFLTLASVGFLQAQPHAGEQSGGAGVTGGRIGDAPAGAPVGSGTLLLIGFAGLYGGKKYVSNRKRIKE